MSERKDTPVADAAHVAAPKTRKPFVRPDVQDIGRLTLRTLGTGIGGEG